MIAMIWIEQKTLDWAITPKNFRRDTCASCRLFILHYNYISLMPVFFLGAWYHRFIRQSRWEIDLKRVLLQCNGSLLHQKTKNQPEDAKRAEFNKTETNASRRFTRVVLIS